MATYRIVDTYRKSKAIKGIHYNSWNEQIVDDPRLDSRPPYLWQWMDDSDILIGNKVYRKPSFKPFLHLRDSEIKKIINQFNRYKI